MNHKKEQEQFFASLIEGFAQAFLDRIELKNETPAKPIASGKDIAELERIYKL